MHDKKLQESLVISLRDTLSITPWCRGYRRGAFVGTYDTVHDKFAVHMPCTGADLT